jgi:hypothetical protein
MCEKKDATFAKCTMYESLKDFIPKVGKLVLVGKKLK